MIHLSGPQSMLVKESPFPKVGTTGHLTIFVWSLGLMVLTPQGYIHIAAAICMVVAVLVFPLPLRRLVNIRWLILLMLLAVPPIFLIGEVDRSLWGVGYSEEGFKAGLQIALRFIVVVVVVNGFTAAEDIAAIAGLLERFGLQGLGFSMGVALNLLPSLQQSSMNAWHSLWMRGGLRRKRWRGLQLLIFTVVTNALRRAEEITLAAEARAFSPERSRALPVTMGIWDWPIFVTALASGIGMMFVK